MTEFSPISIPEDGYYRMVNPQGGSQNIYINNITDSHRQENGLQFFIISGYLIDNYSVSYFRKEVSEDYKFYPFTITFNHESN